MRQRTVYTNKEQRMGWTPSAITLLVILASVLMLAKVEINMLFAHDLAQHNKQVQQ